MTSSPPPRASRLAGHVRDARGLVRLAVHGVVGVTEIAQGLHGSVTRLAPPLGTGPERPAGGIAGFVYGTVRAGSRLVGQAVDAALAGAQALLDTQDADAPADSAARRTLVAALSGVLGDHLQRTGNPLALPMTLSLPAVRGPHVLVLVHGLCMSDVQWQRDGHDHGAALQEALGLSPVVVNYNSGRHVGENGAELAQRLEEMVAHWPVPVQSLAIVGHSMGGLVARSAVHQAQAAGLAWPGCLRTLVFLGTPHHGAALERGGNWLHTAFGVSPYLAPFGRLGRIRSDGITDVRHGNVLCSDVQAGKYLHRDTRTIVPLPRGVACYAVAGALPGTRLPQALGDGLVTVDSALGRHARSTHDLKIPASRTFVAQGVHHLELLSSDAVYRKLRQWLRPATRFS
ncbi:MAG: esterase/lipase family protein [Ramlibacter sp.]